MSRRLQNRTRCDHCGKWQEYCDLVMPNTPEKYWDGSLGVCQDCATNDLYDRAYWTKWHREKYLCVSCGDRQREPKRQLCTICEEEGK